MAFIPALHFRPAAEKLTPEFCKEVVGFYYHNSRLRSLLHDKNVEEIESYASGNFSMKPYRRLFPSLRRQEGIMNDPNISAEDKARRDKTNIQWEPVAMIVSKLNSAISAVQNRAMDITATCLDPLAQRKKAEDLEFLKNKNKMESVIQPLYDSMNLGKADLGGTKHSAIPFTGLPLDLDIEDEQEFMFFANLIYNLAPEFAIETLLEILKEIKKIPQLDYLEILDQFRFGVSCHQVLLDKMTELPNYEYYHPRNIRTQPSLLPDFSDNTFRVIDMQITPMELLNRFPDEISGLEQLQQIVTGKGADGTVRGYCDCNNVSITLGDFDTYKMSIKLCEIKSVDYVMLSQRKNSRFKLVVEDPAKQHEKKWAQNTYQFYWLYNTDSFFGIDRLPFSHRTAGEEILSFFSTNICRSQSKSAVELCIGENKKAQIADIKMQYEIIMAQTSGWQINMKGIRKAVQSMVGLSENDQKEKMKELIEDGKERNIWIYESDDFDGRPGTNQQGQPPLSQLLGGIRNTIEGYRQVIFDANQKISQYTGINDALTGQGTNPDTLIGLEKIKAQASINAIDYVPRALLVQRKSLFNTWFNYIQTIIKKGGAGKKALEDMVGSRQIDIIKGLNEVPLHQMGIKISLGQREEEKQAFRQQMYLKYQQGVLDTYDVWALENIPNPKEAAFTMAVKERRWAKKQEQIRQDQLASQQQMIQTQGENMVKNTQAQVDGKAQLIQVQAQADDALQKSAAQLGLSAAQLEGIIKMKLQQDRNVAQKDKSLSTLGAKSSLDNQKSFV